jgi:hypothetical protein
MIKPPKKLSQKNPKKLLSFRQFLAAKYPKLVVDAPQTAQPSAVLVSNIKVTKRSLQLNPMCWN